MLLDLLELLLFYLYVHFFWFINFFASGFLSTNSITAIGASSPVLNPAFKTLEYPPFLELYLLDNSSKTFVTDFLS